MLKNLSPPIVKSKPASVTTKPCCPLLIGLVGEVNFKANASAMTEEAPMDILAKGPAWTNTGVPSKVCIRLGLIASFNKAVKAPAAPISSAVIAIPVSFCVPTTIFPTAFLMSFKEVDKAKIAISSDATVMSIPVLRGGNLEASFLPSPIVISRTNASLQSTTLLMVMESGSIFNIANFSISSLVKFSGSVSVIPSLFNASSIDTVKVLLPFFAGTSLL